MKLKLLKTPILISVFLISGAGCGCDATETYRESSKDNKVDVVVVEGSCPSTVADWTKVYLVDKGNAISDKNLILYASRVEEFHVEWLHPTLLKITYNNADIYRFKNSWFPGGDSRPWDEVRILEIQKEIPTEPSAGENRDSARFK